MKKILVLLVCLCACFATSYAQKGESALGLNLNYGNDTKIGMGVKYRYGLTDQLRLEPAFNYYFKHDYVSMWDLGANLHYLFPVAKQISVYPLAGIGYAQAKGYVSDIVDGADDVTEGKIAINLGAGVDFKVASNTVIDLELKYQIIDSYNQLVLSAGVAFTF
ncbi:porin family protein [uncultured Bacteroides sp.]|uniref:porin family protein n=1 Tax=uncultured Bacteroides sp. TaxID=162156 RepID=UPI002637A277|nr:porin family protein [uncultured Bacteroides sp.]